MSKVNWTETAWAMLEDEILKVVNKQNSLPIVVNLTKLYQHFWGELFVLVGVLLKGIWIVTPSSMRLKMSVHERPFGIEK